MPGHDPLITEWTNRLRAAARHTLAGTPVVDPASTESQRRVFIEGFRDESGHRRRVDPPFLHALLGLAPIGAARAQGRDLDDRLWWAVHDPSVPLEGFRAGYGPLDPGFMHAGIETWTQTELAAVHALFRLGLDRCEPRLIARALDAAAWHVAELQPDNATNHPWAAHVFVALAVRRGEGGGAEEALLHAQTLLHNCQVYLGRPDRFSACVLWEAAAQLERYGAGTVLV